MDGIRFLLSETNKLHVVGPDQNMSLCGAIYANHTYYDRKPKKFKDVIHKADSICKTCAKVVATKKRNDRRYIQPIMLCMEFLMLTI